MALISKPINLSTEANLLYEIYKTLKKINIASGSSGSQNLAQTLLIDNKTNDIPIVSNNGNGYAYVNDEQTVIGNDFGGTKKITMNEDSFAIETNVRATIDGKGLELGTTTDGFGLPRLTTTQMNAIASPTDGMLVRNTTESKIYQFNGTVWEPLSNPPQTLAQTLAEDNKTNGIPIVSNNGKARVDVNDDYVTLGHGTQTFIMTYTDVQLYSEVPVAFNSTISTDFNTPVLNYNGEEVATQPWVTSQGYGTPKTLAETLAEDNKTNNIPIFSNNGKARVDVNDDYLYIEYENNLLTLEPTNGLRLFSNTQVYTAAPEMVAVIDGEINYTCPSFTLNNEEVATQPYADAKVANDLTASTTVAPSKTAVNTALALKQNIPFEIQFKQTTIDDPLIILSGSIQGNRGATITSSLASPGFNGIYRLTASTDIFKDIKDCYKRTDYYDVNILNFAGSSAIFTWFWYYIDDYTLEVVVTDGLGGSPAAEFLTDYVLLKAEYKD